MSAVQRKPEWCRQCWMYHLAEKILMPPFEVRCIDQANAAQANIASRMMALGRGCKPGTPDMMLWQGGPSVMAVLEVKHETTERPGQEAFAEAMGRCGFFAIRECRTTAEQVAGMRAAGFRLHGNADLLAVEYQERIEAGLRELALRRSGKAAPRKASAKPRSVHSKARVRRGAAIYAAALLG